jgi:hypothetical protein
MAPKARPRFYLATSHLATQAGYMSFDAKQHDAARRLVIMLGPRGLAGGGARKA